MPNLFCAWLRQPNNKRDLRTDPKYEEGTFGSTGCHSDNLLSEKGYRENRIRQRDRIVFIQTGRIVFITPPLKQINKNEDNRVIVSWDSNWESKKDRPLKLQYSMELDLNHARMLNPNTTNLNLIYSHLRSYAQPTKEPEKIVQDFEDYVRRKIKEHGDVIFVNQYCQTFCMKIDCEGCNRLDEHETRCRPVRKRKC